MIVDILNEYRQAMQYLTQKYSIYTEDGDWSINAFTGEISYEE